MCRCIYVPWTELVKNNDALCSACVICVSYYCLKRPYIFGCILWKRIIIVDSIPSFVGSISYWASIPSVFIRTISPKVLIIAIQSICVTNTCHEHDCYWQLDDQGIYPWDNGSSVNASTYSRPGSQLLGLVLWIYPTSSSSLPMYVDSHLWNQSERKWPPSLDHFPNHQWQHECLVWSVSNSASSSGVGESDAIKSMRVRRSASPDPALKKDPGDAHKEEEKEEKRSQCRVLVCRLTFVGNVHHCCHRPVHPFGTFGDHSRTVLDHRVHRALKLVRSD